MYRELESASTMHVLLARFAELSSYLPAILITIGVAALVSCAVGCSSSPCEEKDELFRREVY
jgi:hypothetical protein